MGPVTTLGGLVLPNAETYEQLYPVHIHKYEMRCDAAGAGEFRGGTGIDYVADVRVAADYSFRSEGACGLTAFGINGGQSGKTGSLSLAAMDGTRIDAPQFGVRHLPPLRVTMASPAGGGFGDPRLRPPEKVLRDVADGLISLRHAHDVYGVAITGNPPRIDVRQTEVLRAASPDAG